MVDHKRASRGWSVWITLESCSIGQAQRQENKIEGASVLASVRLEGSNDDRAPSTLFA